MDRRYGSAKTSGIIAKAAAFLLVPLLLLSGCGRGEAPSAFRGEKEIMKELMTYSEEELKQIDEFVSRTAGVTMSFYKSSLSSKAAYTCVAPDVCTMPENAFDDPAVAGSRFIRVEGYICFSEGGAQNIALENGGNWDMTVTYNELHTSNCTEKTVFAANVYYKFNLCYDYVPADVPVKVEGGYAATGAGETVVSFHSDHSYKLSTQDPSFGGRTAEKYAPIADIHIRDPFIMLSEDGFYYMIGTYEPDDWANTREIHIYRSPDLAGWTDLGAVWNFERDATWQKDILTDGTSPIWAPELHYIDGNYWICYSLGWGAMNGSVLRSTTGRVEGPYEDVGSGPIFDYIDSTLFVDGGKVYAIWSDGLLSEMKSGLTGLARDPVALTSASGKRVGFEGCYVMKIDGVYYLFSSTYTFHLDGSGKLYQTYDSYYAFSDRLEGPYSERRLLLERGGHNNLFYDKEGNLYTTAFYGEGFSERPAVVRITVEKNGLLTVS
jgi:hypothetical protein